MSANRIRLWRGAIYLALLTAGLALVFAWWPELAQIWRQHFVTFLVAALLMGAGLVIQAGNFAAFLETGDQLGRWRLSSVWALSALANYAGPLQPGIAVRILYLKRCGVAVDASMLATWRQLVVSLWISLLGLGISVYLLDLPGAHLVGPMLVVAFALLYLLRRAVAAWLAGIERPQWFATRKELLVRASQRFDLPGVAGVGLQYAVGTLLLIWVYGRFGADVSLPAALFMACAVYVSALLAVLPGNIGVMEAIYVIGGQQLGLSVAESAALAILLRIAHISAATVLAIPALSGRWWKDASRAS